MTTLFIDACVRDCSRTRTLAETVLKKLGDDVQRLELYSAGISHLDGDSLDLRDRCVKSGDFDAPMLKYAKDFASADAIVIAAPYWDLSFPAILKEYIEQIMVTGITFRYSEAGIPIGMCKAVKLIYVSTAGGPVIGRHMGFEYVSTLAESFLGIKDTMLIQAENLDIIGADVDKIMADAISDIENSSLFKEL